MLVLSSCAVLGVEEEVELGRQEQRVIEQRATPFRDRRVVGYVRGLGSDLAMAARPAPFELRFYVIEDDDLNAFAIPGGAVYVNTGLLLEVRDPSDIAAILAHEIGHLTARHVAMQYRRARNTGLLAQIFGLFARLFTRQPDLGELLVKVGASVDLNTYTQEAEREADVRCRCSRRRLEVPELQACSRRIPRHRRGFATSAWRSNAVLRPAR